MPGRREYYKGKRYEIKLMQKLKKLGYFVMRSPGSGRGTRKIWYPDVVAIRKERVVFIEVKERGDNRDIHLPKQQYRQYRYIQDLAGAEFYLCVFYQSIREFRCLGIDRFDYETYRYYVYKFRSFVEKGHRVEEVFK